MRHVRARPLGRLAGRRWGTCALVTLCATLVLRPARADVLPFGLKIERVLDHAGVAGDVEQSPTAALWILERDTGVVRVVDAGVEVANVTIPVRTGCGAGLLDVAFAPDHRESGRAFVSFVDPSGALRVDEVRLDGDSLAVGATIVSPGITATGCRAGGGLAVGPDGTLYVGVGDLDQPSRAQNDRNLAGKVLRMNLDGSVPADNPIPRSLVWAKGFRDVEDIALRGSVGAVRELVVADAGGDHDELNAVVAGGNYGWSVTSGDSGGTFDDPEIAWSPAVTARGLVFDERLGGSALYQARGDGTIWRIAATARTFFDPLGDRDGSADAACPGNADALAAGRDGMLYAASGGDPATAGIWRIWADAPGPREVSPPGSPFPLTVDHAGGTLVLGWENLGALDAGRPVRHGGQHAATYTVWQGTLPLDGVYDHAVALTTDGAATAPARRSADLALPAGSHYFLVTAQGDNLEGPAGSATDGAPRGVAIDYCAARGYGRFTGECVEDFRDPLTGAPIKLVDLNPFSPTYQQALSVRDFRGSVVHLDISADNCFWCNLQAPTYPPVDRQYRDRDFVLLTVLNLDLLGPKVIPPEDCATVIEGWATRHGLETPVFCDPDVNGDTLGDVARQFWHAGSDPEGCGGTPQNFFIDQGGAIFDFVCSFAPGDEVATLIDAEVNAETCE